MILVVIMMESIKGLYDIFMQDREVYCVSVTLNSYNFYIPRFLTWLNSDNLSDLTKQNLKEYIIYLRGSMKNTSVRTNYRPVKAFCKWLFQEDYIEKDITVGIRLPKNDAAIVEPLTDEEVTQIDNAIISGSNSLRNYCIFRLMLDCGLRRQEVINLKRKDVKFDRIIIRNSKNNKDRIVLLPKFLYLSIHNYYISSHYAHDYVISDSPYVFLDRLNHTQITEDTIKKMFQKLKASSGVNRVHAHLCRHTFATSFLQYGGNMEKLRLYMGHSDYEILKNYLHISLVYPDVYKLDDIFFKDFKKI